MTSVVPLQVPGQEALVAVPSLTEWLRDEYPRLLSSLRDGFLPMPGRFSGDITGCMIEMGKVAPLLGLMPHDFFPPSVAQSVEKRRIAFLAGRLCAEQAMSGLTESCHVDHGSGGEPIWPRGLRGSITHTDQLAWAAVTNNPVCKGLGIDSEIIIADSEVRAIAEICCTAAERSLWLDNAGEAWYVTLFFSAKEAWFKAAYPMLHRFVDFREVEIAEVDLPQGVIRLRPAPEIFARGIPSTASCRFSWDMDMVHTLVCL